jgi:acetyltransferase-like isoleucine patch superfamily enzyme
VWLWRSAGFSVSHSANITSTVRLIFGDIEIGESTFVGEETMITGGTIKIGANCDIAPRCTIHAGSHQLGFNNRRAGNAYTGKIIIGDGSWVGTNVTILAGTELGKGTIVAAGALVVAGKYPENVLLAGIPARINKKLAPLCSYKASEDESK